MLIKRIHLEDGLVVRDCTKIIWGVRKGGGYYHFYFFTSDMSIDGVHCGNLCFIKINV